MSSLASVSAVPRPSTNWLPIQIAIFCLIWSFSFVAGKVAATDCPPLIFLAVRFGLAGIIILGISLARGDVFSLSWRDVVVFALLGLANNALYLGFGYTGLQTVSAGLGGLVTSANPVFTAVLAALFLGETMTWRKALGLLLGVTGVTVIVWHRLGLGTDSLHGILFTLASLASLVTGTFLFKLLAPKGSLWVGNGIQNLVAGLALTPVAFTLSSASEVVPSFRLLAAFAFLTLCGSMLAYMIWFRMLTVHGATAASAYHFVMPPLAILFAWAILGEHVVAFDLLGIVPVVAGVYLVTRAAVRKPQSLRKITEASQPVVRAISAVTRP